MVPLESFAYMIADMKKLQKKEVELKGKQLVPNLRHEEKSIWVWDDDITDTFYVFDYERKKAGSKWIYHETSLKTILKKYK